MLRCSRFRINKVILKKHRMLKFIRIVSLSLCIVAFFNSCKKSDTSNSCPVTNYNPCALQAPASEIQAVKDYLSANGLTATQHCSGLFYIIDAPGTGATPAICSAITVSYEGKLTNGTVFDSSPNGGPFFLYQLIAGWQAGIPLIKNGGSIRLFIPPSLGYGSTANGPIPANSVLIFRVDLKSVQ